MVATLAVVVAAVCTIVFSLIFKPTAIEQAEREQTKKALKEAQDRERAEQQYDRRPVQKSEGPVHV